MKSIKVVTEGIIGSDCLRGLKRDIHANAVSHGWWHDHSGAPLKKHPYEVMQLLLCEVAEIMEDYRSGKACDAIWADEHGKPCGIPTELADVVIRLWDYQQVLEEQLQERYTKSLINNECFDPSIQDRFNQSLHGNQASIIKESLPVALGYLSCKIADEFSLLIANRIPILHDRNTQIDRVCFAIAKIYCGLDTEEFAKVIREKHEFNKTRPYRHGNKRC